MPPFRDAVRFRDVGFGYLPDRPVLAGIGLEARPGTVTAIVGPTVSGKSTMMSLLLRLADPDTGSIEIDGNDLRKLEIESLRSEIALATQENILFSDTVLENIRYAAPGATRAAAIAARQGGVRRRVRRGAPERLRRPWANAPRSCRAVSASAS